MLTSPSIRSELDRARLADRRRRDDIPAGHAAVIDTVFRHLRPVVNELGTSLFDNAPDVLLAMAEDMDGGPEQRLYFEAIRTLKSIRGPVYLVFKTTLLGRVRAQHVDAPGAPAEPELSLRDDDSLEEVIAISNIVQDIEASHGQQLYEMECRLQAAVRAGVPLEPASLMPIGIVEAFNTALADVDVTPKIKLVMFRLFSHFIAQRLDEFLGAVITALDACGFQPAQAEGDKDIAEAAAHEPELRSALEQVRRLLGSDGSAGTGGAAGAGGSGGAAGGGGSGGAAGSEEAEGAEGSVGDGPAATTGKDADAGLLKSLHDLLRRVASGDESSAWAQAAVQRVGMSGQLVNELVRDIRVPMAVREQVESLRLLMTKAALSDPEFFSRPDHPARRLFSDIHDMALTSGALGAGDAQQLTQLIRDAATEMDIDAGSVADRMNRCQTVDAHAVDGFLQQQAEASAARSKRLVKRFKEVVRGEIQERIEGIDMPQGAEQFLVHGFGPLMCMMLARHGRESDQYRSSLRRLDRLTDQLREQPFEELLAEDRSRLLDSVELDLTEAGMPRERIEQTMSGLREAYETLDRKRSEKDQRNRELLEGVRERIAWADKDFAGRLRMDLRRLVGDAISDEIQRGHRNDDIVAGIVGAEPESAARRRKALMKVLVPGSWFRIRTGTDKPVSWGRVERYFAAEDIVSFSGFDGEVFLTVRGEELLERVREGELYPVEVNLAAERRWEELLGVPIAA